MQKKIRHDTAKENADIISVILYSDSTALSQDLRVSAWPIYMTLANIPLSRRKHPGSFQLLGLIPPHEGTTAEKQGFFSECLNIVLEPLKKLSYDGLYYNGRWLFPIIYSYIADHPEGSKVMIQCIALSIMLYKNCVYYPWKYRCLSLMGVENAGFRVVVASLLKKTWHLFPLHLPDLVTELRKE